ncbi:MAG: hypothetical protein IT506_03110 [Aquabacterium sp.]|nr:hypothetical protein [Aquabacterium sp.]
MAAFAITAIWTLWAVHGPQRGLMRLGPWLTIAVTLMVVSPNIWWNIQNHFPTLEHTAQITTKSDRAGGVLAALQFLLGQVVMLGPVAVAAGIWLYKKPFQQEAETVPASQWAASSQMMPPSQWAAGRPAIAKSSAFYFASVSSYRFLWATSVPLLIVALVQAFHADAHVNWAAPAMVGLTMLIATRLSAPLVPIATPKPNRWLVAAIVSNLLLTSVVLHLQAMAGGTLPAKLDVMVRMRGWQQAFDDLSPVLQEPTVKGLPVLTNQRLLITQAAYHWRQHDVQLLAWNPKGERNDHYQFKYSLPDKVGQDLVLLTDTATPDDILQRFANVRLLKSTKVMTAPDRSIELHVFLLRGFLAYDQQSYDEQTGVNTPTTTED